MECFWNISDDGIVVLYYIISAEIALPKIAYAEDRLKICFLIWEFMSAIHIKGPLKNILTF